MSTFCKPRANNSQKVHCFQYEQLSKLSNVCMPLNISSCEHKTKVNVTNNTEPRKNWQEAIAVLIMSYMVKRLDVDSQQEYQIIGAKVYSTNPGLYQQQSGSLIPSALMFQSKTKMFYKATKHRVAIVQEIASEDVKFKLWEGNDYSQSKEAFHRIEGTLAPLLNNGCVLLTQNLLKEIILPSPKDPKKLCSHLVDVMERNPNTHPEWLDVIQALLKKSEPLPLDPSLRKEYIASLKSKFDSRKQSSVVNLLATVPFVAMPNCATSIDSEDDQESDKVWTLFRRGTLFSQGAQKSGLVEKTNTWPIDSVMKGYQKSCINLILSRVNSNEQCPSTGDTALHIAVRKGNLTLVKLLLAHQANPAIANNENETPIDAARKTTCKDADEILAALEVIEDLQKQAKSYYSQNMELPAKKGSCDAFLLSLDGGGIRSSVACHILAAIEARMKDLCSSCEPLQSHFDYIAGTSSGAIIAAMLLYKSTTSVSHAGMYFYKFMNHVFGSEKMERSEKLKEFVTDAVGESTVMSDLPKGNIIVTATIANTNPSKLHLITNYGEERDGLSGPNERKVWEALVASSAAPTYFPAFECFLDGGLMANNPTLAAMTDIFNRAKTEDRSSKVGFVLSIGTGHVPTRPSVENFEVYVPGFSIDVIKTLLHSSKGLVRLLTHFIQQSTKCDGEIVHQASAWCSSIGATYWRLSPPLANSVAPDVHSTKELVSLLFQTEIYILQEHINIDKIAKAILSK